MEDQENVVPAEIAHHGSRKPKKPPPVTPKRFTRFFTPRSSMHRVTKSSQSKAGRQLREITQSGLNSRSNKERSRLPKKSVVFKDFSDLQNVAITPVSTTSSKKRKAYLSPESLPFDSSPCKRACPAEVQEDHIPSSPPAFEILPTIHDRSESPELRLPPRPNRRLASANTSGRILERSFADMRLTGRPRRKQNCTCQWTYFFSRDIISNALQTGKRMRPTSIPSLTTLICSLAHACRTPPQAATVSIDQPMMPTALTNNYQQTHSSRLATRRALSGSLTLQRITGTALERRTSASSHTPTQSWISHSPQTTRCSQQHLAIRLRGSLTCRLRRRNM